MKKIFFVLLTFITLTGFSQNTRSVYIEVRGSVDALGNIYLVNLIKPNKPSKTDSLIDYASLNKIILKLRDPIRVMNELAGENWALVSVTNVLSDDEKRPNSPFLLYYFRKDFKMDH